MNVIATKAKVLKALFGHICNVNVGISVHLTWVKCLKKHQAPGPSESFDLTLSTPNKPFYEDYEMNSYLESL